MPDPEEDNKTPTLFIYNFGLLLYVRKLIINALVLLILFVCLLQNLSLFVNLDNWVVIKI